MVEADLEEVRGRGVARDVAAQLAARAIGAHHHRERVPAHQRREARLDLEVALVGRLLASGMVLTYGVASTCGSGTRRVRACCSSRRSRKVARSGPSAAISASSASIHSRVSSGSMSAMPSARTAPMCRARDRSVMANAGRWREITGEPPARRDAHDPRLCQAGNVVMRIRSIRLLGVLVLAVVAAVANAAEPVSPAASDVGTATAAAAAPAGPSAKPLPRAPGRRRLAQEPAARRRRGHPGLHGSPARRRRRELQRLLRGRLLADPVELPARAWSWR